MNGRLHRVEDVANMRFVTLQAYDLRTFPGPIKLAYGTYKDDPLVSPAQRRLYDLIGEDQVVWCGRDEPHLSVPGQFVHDVDVDTRDIVAVVNTLVWCQIIGNERYIPKEDYPQVKGRAAEFQDDYAIALRKAEDEYLSANIPEDLWAAVTKPGITKASDQVLLRFPLAHSTVVNVDVVSPEMTILGKRKP